MALDRLMLNDLVTTHGSNNFDNIEYIITTNSDIIRLSWYQRNGAGIRWVDKDLGAGVHLTGVELYRSLPPSVETSLDENGTKVITFIEVGAIDRIAFKAPVAPAWAWQPPGTP